MLEVDSGISSYLRGAGAPRRMPGPVLQGAWRRGTPRGSEDGHGSPGFWIIYRFFFSVTYVAFLLSQKEKMCLNSHT